MNNRVIELFKKKNFVIPNYLVCNYRALNINVDELIILIYFINSDSLVLNYKDIGSALNINFKELIMIIESLKDKKLIEVNLVKNISDKMEEVVCLDLFYNKLFLDNIKDDSTDLFSYFESEFKRTLSPTEYELLSGWREMYKEDIIKEALKEAIICGAINFKYIDRILFDWNSKGIDSVDKIKNNKSFKKKEVVKAPLYDWLKNE